MPTLSEIVSAFESYIGSALSLTTIQGFPDFTLDHINPPLVALVYAGSGAAPAQRIGRARLATVVSLNVYQQNEAGLHTAAETLRGLRVAPPVLTVGGDLVRCTFGDDEREPITADDPIEYRHLIRCSVALAYE